MDQPDTKMPEFNSNSTTVAVLPGRLKRSREYTVTTTSVKSLLGRTTRTETVAVVRKEFLKDEEDGFTFRIKTLGLARDFDQAMTPILRHLAGELVVKTDRAGKPVRIENLSGIRDRWQEARAELVDLPSRASLISGMDSAFKDDLAVSRMIMSMPTVRIVAPGIYRPGCKIGSTISSSCQVDGFFFDAALPLDLEQRLLEWDSATGVKTVARAGTLDRRRVDHKRIRQTAKAAKGRLDIKVDKDGESEEVFELDADNWFTSARRRVSGSIPGILVSETITTLEPANPSSR